MTEEERDLCYRMAMDEARIAARFMDPKPTGEQLILMTRRIAEENISRLLVQESSLRGESPDAVAPLGGLDGDAEPTP